VAIDVPDDPAPVDVVLDPDPCPADEFAPAAHTPAMHEPPVLQVPFG